MSAWIDSRRVRRSAIVLAAVSAVLTVAVSLVPATHLAFRSATLRVALGTASSLVAVLAAFLVFGRLRRRGGRSELLLVCALVFLAVSSVFVAVSNGDELRSVVVWEGRVCGAAGALLLAPASVAPRLRMNRRSWSLVVAAAIAFWLTALTLLLISSFGEHVPMGAQASMPTSLPDLDVPAGVVALMGLNALLFAIAAVGFLREAERRGDEFSAWLAIAAILAAFSRLNYLVMPTRYTDWVYVGDGFWLLCCIVLLIGALREITSYWRSATEAAVLEERRRIARDLHDGVAQELAYLDRNLRSFEPLTDRQHERLSRLQRAVERAQRESRQALAALAAPVDAPLDVALSRAATEVADRFGIELELDLASGARVSPARTESLLRIACEAVTNAARHSGQRFVSVSLEYDGDDVRLRVRDPGRGFDPTASSSGFGLVSMRDRARAAGGELRVESSPGRGTLVEVAL